MTAHHRYATTPADTLPAHVCPTCRHEMPVDRMPHRDCQGWDETSTTDATE